MATGLRCTVDACEYNTDSQVPNDTDLPTKVQLLQIHAGSVHNDGGGQVRTPGSKDTAGGGSTSLRSVYDQMEYLQNHDGD